MLTFSHSSQFKRRDDAIADALELLRNSKDSEVRLYRRGKQAEGDRDVILPYKPGHILWGTKIVEVFTRRSV